MVVEARQSFQVLRQITWFFGCNRALSICRYQILHYLIELSNYKIDQSVKANFVLTTRATLRFLQ